MPSKTWYASKDARIAQRNSDGWDAGAGKSAYLPVGLWQGYVYRALIDFATNWSGVTKIVSAKLRIKTTGQHYVGFGSDPDIIVQRLTSGWSEGSSVDLSSGNAVIWPGPSATSTNEVVKDVTTSEGTWVEIDITDLIDDIAPTGVTRSDGLAGSGSGGLDGLRLRANDEGSSADTTEFYSRESGSDPRIVLTYISNTTPSAPQWVSPGSGAIVATTAPTFVFDAVDADGDNPSSYEIQVDTTSGNGVEPDWASLTWASGSGQTSGISGKRITRAAGGTYSRGQWYAARARTTDNEGEVSGWSIRYFKINSLPTATPSSPIASNLAYIHNLGDAAEWTSGGTDAKPRLRWTYADSDGHGQTAYQVQVGTDGVNADVGDTGEVASAATFVDTAWGVPNGTNRYWRVRVKDAAGEWGNYSSWTVFKVRWGQSIYEHAPTGGSNSRQWRWSSSPTPANTQSAFVFRTATGASGAGASAWSTQIGSLTPNTYLNVLVRLASYASGTNPTLSDMEFTYIGSGIQPDHWFRGLFGADDWALDPDQRRYGSQCLRCIVSSVSAFDRQLWPGEAFEDTISVVPGTPYVFSCWVKTKAPLATKVYLVIHGPDSIAEGLESNGGATSDTSSYPDGWQRISLQYTPGPGEFNIRPIVTYTNSGAGSVGDTFWIDAVSFEEGTVVSKWSPGQIGAAILDSGGISVDGLKGGIFRLRGNTGGARDTVQLGDNGLIFGSDIEVYSDTTGELHVGGHLKLDGSIRGFGASFPASPTVNDLYFRTDLAMWFSWTGAHWLCSCPHQSQLRWIATAGSQSLSATAAAVFGAGAPDLLGGSDIWLVKHKAVFLVGSGTALSGSHKWVGTVQKYVPPNTGTTFATVNIDSGANSDWREVVTSINAVLNGGTTNYRLATTWTKTGTPGALTVFEELTYRIKAT